MTQSSITYNYVRATTLEPISIESLAIVVTLIFLLYLLRTKQASLEAAYFLAIPFSDLMFRVGSIQPVEFLSLFIVLRYCRGIRSGYPLAIGFLFVLFAITGLISGAYRSSYSIEYSLRFLLTAGVFSVFIKRPFVLSTTILKFAVVFAFALTYLQAGLWLLGFPIHGIFYNGIVPRPKGLAHEPATWSIWILSLFPYILYFRLGQKYLLANVATLLITFSTFGVVCALVFVCIRPLFQSRTFRLPRVRIKHVKQIAAAVAAILAIICIWPQSLDQASKFAAVFDKLVEYESEISRAAGNGIGGDLGGYASAGSGRGSDILMVEKYFPPNWLIGVGSFNSAPISDDEGYADTNTYLAFSIELGLLGCSLLAVLLILHYRSLLREPETKSADFLAMSLTFLLMIAGIRCFAFHELWYTQANTLRLRRSADNSLPEAEEPHP